MAPGSAQGTLAGPYLSVGSICHELTLFCQESWAPCSRSWHHSVSGVHCFLASITVPHLVALCGPFLRPSCTPWLVSVWCPENSLAGVLHRLSRHGLLGCKEACNFPERTSVCAPSVLWPTGFFLPRRRTCCLCCPWGYQLCLPQQEGCTVRMGGGCYMPSGACLSLSIRTWHGSGYGLRCVPCPGGLTMQEQRHPCLHLGSWGMMGNCGPRVSWDNGLSPLRALRESCLEVGGRVCSVRPHSLWSITVQQALG